MSFVISNSNKPIEFTEMPTELSLSLSGSVAGGGQSPNQIDLRLKLGGTMNGGPAFVLTLPPPILPQIDENAFSNQFYTARLLGEFGNEILIDKARIEKPLAQLGEIVFISVGKKDLAQISVDKSYTFQIGKCATATTEPVWRTIVENAKLSSRQYQIAKRRGLPADSLSFETIETTKDRLNRVPMKNYIFFDRARTNVEASEIEKIYDSNGEAVATQVFGYNGLTLYKILSFVAQKCGFAAFSPENTNIPNFELVRVDFSYKKSYRETLNGYVGTWQPMFKVLPGNVLQIQSEFAPIPDDFEPVALTVENYSQLDLQIPSSVNISAVEVTYVDSNTQADTTEDFTDPQPKILKSGEYGDPDYSETRILQTHRRWTNSAQPLVVLDEKLIRERHSTYNASDEKTDEETTEYFYDSQAKNLGMLQTVRSTVPNLEATPPAAILQTVKETRQTNTWAVDPKNPRRQYLYSKITRTSGLIAVDSENQALGPSGELEDYRQDFEKVYEHGNLTAGMTSLFAPIKSETETLTPLGNGQFLLRREERDLILNKSRERFSETQVGDGTVNSVGGKSRQFLIWRDGESQSSNSGGEIIELSVGELPFEFFVPLARLILEKRLNGFQTGTVTVPGWHESLDRGVFFRISDREGNDLGRFLCKALTTEFDRLGVAGQQTVISTITISEV